MKTNLGEFNLPIGYPVVLEVNPMTLADAKLDNISPIQDKFMRFANITPTKPGQMGPEWMKYQIYGNLPTDKRCSVRHVSLPADMKPEAVAFIFEIFDLVSLATNGLGHIGGASNSGIIDIVRNTVGSLSNIVSTVASPIVNSLKGVLEGPRDLRFLKPTVEGDTEDSISPLLMLLAENPSEGLSSIDVNILLEMIGMSVDRLATDRTVLPPTTKVVPNSVMFNSQDAMSVYRYFIDYFSHYTPTEGPIMDQVINTKQFENYLKFKIYFNKLKYSNSKKYNVLDILAVDIPSNLEALRIPGQNSLEYITKCPLFNDS